LYIPFLGCSVGTRDTEEALRARARTLGGAGADVHGPARSERRENEVRCGHGQKAWPSPAVGARRLRLAWRTDTQRAAGV
jgi:hypothetical protein